MFVASLVCCISYLTYVIVIIKYHQFSIDNEHNKMSKYARLRIHIAPLGFESDRIVLPAIEMKADKVWIFVDNDPTKTEAKPYLEEIKKRLKQKKIEFEIMKFNRLNLFSTLKGVKDIIETGKQHTYYVNVSSGSKIQAIACTMACMMFNVSNNLIPYYVQPKKYFPFKGKPQSSGMQKIIDLPQYEIQTPEEKLIKALGLIEKNKGRITKKDLADLAEEEKLIEIGAKEENRDQARFASLQKNIIEPLKDHWKFIVEEKSGRTRWISITEEGKNVREVLS